VLRDGDLAKYPFPSLYVYVNAYRVKDL
jgi:hypothetical protein